MKFYTLLCLAFLLLAGCSTNPNKHTKKLHIDVPGKWSTEDAIDGAVSNAWLSDFKNEKLLKLVDDALENNLDLQAAAARMDAAKAEMRIAGASQLPQISARGGASRSKRNFIGFSGLTGGSSGGVVSSRSDTYSLGLDISWEIDLWGKLNDTRKSALERFKAAEVIYEGSRLSLAARTVEVWYAVVESVAQLKIAEDTVKSYSHAEELINERYKQGISSILDMRTSRAVKETAAAAVKQREMQYQSTVRAFELLLGRYPSTSLSVDGEFDFDYPPIKSGLPSELLARRPDLLAAAHDLESAGFSASSAAKAMLPSISLTASGGTSSDKLKEVLNQDYSVWNLAGNILQPVFQGGRLKAASKREKALWEEKLINYRTAVLKAFEEVEGGITAERLLKEKETHLSIAEREASEAGELALDRYSSGLDDVLVLLDAQRKAYAAKSDLLSVKLERLKNRLDLYMALGGGFEETKEEESK